MKKMIVSAAAMAVLLFGLTQPASAQMMGYGSGGMMQPYGQGQGYQQGAQGWTYCPNCGAYLPRNQGDYGQGYGQGYGQPMGPGMMGHGWGQWPGMMTPGMMPQGVMPQGGMGPGMMGYGYNQGMMAPLPRPLEEEGVRSMVQFHLENFVRNPNLKLGTVKDAGEAFEVTIVTKDDSLVNRFLVNKSTGWMQPMQ